MAANTTGARIFRRVKEKLFLLFATVLFTIFLIPTFFFFMVPCYIYRKIVTYIALWFKPQLGKLLCARSSLAASDELFTNPKCTLLGVAILEGDIELQKLRQDVMTRIVQAQTLKGELLYPEFQQYFSPWAGFTFWKWEKDFKIEDHVNVYEKSETADTNEMDLINLRVELVSKPYKKGISPWEFVVIRNYCPTQPLIIDIDNNCEDKGKPQKSVLILRIHHGVTDGYALLKLFLHTMQDSEKKLKLENIPQPKFQKRNYLKLFLHYLWAALCVPYYVTEQLLTTYDDNYFHPKGAKLVRKCFAAGTTFPVSIVREIREKNNVTFSSVLMSAVAGGVRNYMLANGLQIPDRMHVTTPLPWPGHPSKLRNFWSFCITRLPLEVSDPKERLKNLDKQREGIIHSTIPLLNLVLVPLVGALPTPVIQWATKRKATTIMMSNFPGPQEPSSMFGYSILDASFGGGFGRGNLAFGISMISYNGTMRLGIGIDQAIFPSQPKAQELLGLIKEEIYILAQDVIV